MNEQFGPQVPDGNPSTGPMPATGALSKKSEVLKSAASDWAGTLKETVRERMTDTGSKAETYVRSHPGRFIASACCLGLAAGWFLGRQRRDGDS